MQYGYRPVERAGRAVASITASLTTGLDIGQHVESNDHGPGESQDGRYFAFDKIERSLPTLPLGRNLSPSIALEMSQPTQ